MCLLNRLRIGYTRNTCALWEFPTEKIESITRYLTIKHILKSQCIQFYRDLYICLKKIIKFQAIWENVDLKYVNKHKQ